MSFRVPAVSLLLLVAFVPVRADAADGPRLSVPVAGRPLTIGHLNLLLGAEPGLLLTPAANIPQVILPLRFGLGDDFELFAGPIYQTVDPNFHDPALGAVFRFLKGPLELGVRGAAGLSLFGQVKTGELQLGVPIRIHLGNVLAVDLGAHAVVGFLPATTVGVLIPAGLTLNIGDSLFAGVSGAARVGSFADVQNTLAAPVGATIGWTIASGDRPFLDLAVRAGLDDVRTPANFSVGGSAKIYFFF